MLVVRPDETPGTMVVVSNPSPRPRTDLVTVRLTISEPSLYGLRVVDHEGSDCPVLLENPDSHPGGGLRAVDVTVLARDIPPMGTHTLTVRPTTDPSPIGWAASKGHRIETGSHTLKVDPARGGCVSLLRDKATGADLLPPGSLGNELLLDGLAGSGAAPAEVTVESSAIGERITVTGTTAGVRHTQTITLWYGLPRVDCSTTLTRTSGAGGETDAGVGWPGAYLVTKRDGVAVWGRLPLPSGPGPHEYALVTSPDAVTHPQEIEVRTWPHS